VRGKNWKATLGVASRVLTVAAAGLLALSCSMGPGGHETDHGAAERGLSIRIAAPESPRGLSAQGYVVTSLDIEVKQVATDTVVAAFTWLPPEGSAQYDVSVPVAGDYEIIVTHHGENGGNTVAALESVVVSIQPMIISVVTVTPGQIGVIIVGGTQTGVLYGDFAEIPGSLGAPADVLFAVPVTVAQGGFVTHLGLINFDTTAQVVMALYEDDGGSPGNLVVTTAATSLVVGQQEIPVSPTVISAGSYWVGAVYDNVLNVRGAVTGGNGYRFATHLFADPLPDPFPAIHTFFADRRLNHFLRVLN
jgi:hypothetical protein